MVQCQGPNAWDVRWLIDFSAQRSRASWFSFQPLLQSFSVGGQTTCFFLQWRVLTIREKGVPPQGGGKRVAYFLDCNQKLSRTNRRGLKKIQVICWNKQENSTICKSWGQRSDMRQLKFHYAANGVKSLKKMFTEPEHDLSIQVSKCVTWGNRTARCVHHVFNSSEPLRI